MRILHTSDWHLGQKFIAQSREAEQSMALDWLLEVIVRESVETLVVAGDIFDVHNPPVAAEDLYYSFLTRLQPTPCRHVVIIGGNHDSAAKLNAPKGLLRALDIHVVGAISDDIGEEVIALRGAEGRVEAVIAAVPFMRDRDFRFTTAAESPEDRIKSIQAGIVAHYQALASLILEQSGGKKDPLCFYLAMGHLYAKGASSTEEQQNIYLGNMDNIAAEQLPTLFDYIALGHIHRAQKIGKKDHIRYCGSLIPLSFSEVPDQKGVLLVEFQPNNGITEIRTIAAPVFRRLLTIKGSILEIERQLTNIAQSEGQLSSWVDLLITGEQGLASPERHLRDFAQNMPIEILKIRSEHTRWALDEGTEVVELSQLTPAEVFAQRCTAEGLNEAQTLEMKIIFDELQAWAEDNADKIRL